MEPSSRTDAAETVIANEQRDQSPAMRSLELIADFLPAPLGPAIRMFTRLNTKRIENLEYLHACMRDDLRDLGQSVDEQAAKHENFYRDEIPSILIDGFQRAETLRMRSKIKRIGNILVHALVTGPDSAPQTTEEMLRVAANLDDLDVEILRQIVEVQKPHMVAGRDALGMNVVNPLWKENRPKVGGLSDGDLTSTCHKLESFGLITRIDKRSDKFGPDEPAPPFGLLRKGIRFAEFAIRGPDAVLSQDGPP
jgi:hypothetical protein